MRRAPSTGPCRFSPALRRSLAVNATTRLLTARGSKSKGLARISDDGRVYDPTRHVPSPCSPLPTRCARPATSLDLGRLAEGRIIEVSRDGERRDLEVGVDSLRPYLAADAAGLPAAMWGVAAG